MSLSEFWQGQGAELLSQFEASRRALSDSHVKGGSNEELVEDMLKRSLGPRLIKRNVQLIDANGERSDEVDLAICNQWQPFVNSSIRLLIAEGVDAVVQVKASLDGDELERCYRNAATVKRLRRTFEVGATVLAQQHDTPYFVDRLPYFCVALDTKLSAITTAQRLHDMASQIPSEEQLDGLFVIGKCVALNIRGNEGALSLKPKAGRPPLPWAVMEADAGQAWSMLLRAIYVTSPPPVRMVHPLSFYPFLAL